VILRVWRIQQLILFCVIGCADHCVYVGAGTIFANSGGSGRVGSGYAEILLVLSRFFVGYAT